MSEPAIVQGSEQRAIIYFIEDADGSLVDLVFECCTERPADALPWPCFDFATDYATHCNECGALIHKPYEEGKKT